MTGGGDKEHNESLNVSIITASIATWLGETSPNT